MLRRARCGILYTLMLAWSLAGCAALARGQLPPGARDNDNRLAQRVSVHERAKTVRELLAILSKTSSVALRSSPETADLHVSVFVRNLPLGALQARLAETLHLAWKRIDAADGQGPPAYELYRSRDQQAAEERLIARGDDAFREGIEDAIKAVSYSPEELEKLQKENPILAGRLEAPDGRAAAGMVGQLSADQRQRLYNGERLRFPLSQASPEFRRGAKDLLQAHEARAQALGVDLPNSNPDEVAFRSVEEGADRKIVVELKSSMASHASTIYGTTSSRIFGDLNAMRSEEEYADARRPLVLSGTLSGKNLDELLEKIAETLQVNIISESYVFQKTEEQRPLAAGKRTLEAMFDSILWGDAMWWKHGSVHMVQRKLWFLDRQALVPEATMTRIKEAFKNHPLGLEQYAELGLLNSKQWMTLQGRGVGEFDQLLPLYPLLSFYSCLPELQKKSLLSGSGISSAHLNKADRKRLMAWIRSAVGNEGSFTDDDANNPIRVYGSVDSQQTTFRAVTAASNDDAAILARQSLPVIPRSAVRKAAEPIRPVP